MYLFYVEKSIGLKWPHGNGNGSIEEVLEHELELQNLGKASSRPPRWEKQNEQSLFYCRHLNVFQIQTVYF